MCPTIPNIVRCTSNICQLDLNTPNISQQHPTYIHFKCRAAPKYTPKPNIPKHIRE